MAAQRRFSAILVGAVALLAALSWFHDAVAQSAIATGEPTGAEKCLTTADTLDHAIQAADGAAIERAAGAFLRLPGCDDGVRMRLRRAASRTLSSLALRDHGDGLSAEATAQRLNAARRIGQVWDTLLASADIAFEQHDFSTATRFYQDALNDMEEQDALNDMKEAPPNEPRPSAERYAYVYQRANETQMLAPEVLAAPRRDSAGPGGLDAALASDGSRNIAVGPRFLPVTFVTDRAEMTDTGRSFVERWWGGLQAASPPALVIVGHTDPRGTDAWNDPLSVARATAMAVFLRNQGYTGALKILGYGRRCPVQFSKGTDYTQDERNQIMRRVEVFRGDTVPAGYCSNQPAVAARFGH